MINIYFPIIINQDTHPNALPLETWELKVIAPETKFVSDGLYAKGMISLNAAGVEKKIDIEGKFFVELSDDQQYLLLKMSEAYIPLDINAGIVQLKIASFRIDTLLPPIKIPLMHNIKVPNKGLNKIRLVPKFDWYKDQLHVNIKLKHN